MCIIILHALLCTDGWYFFIKFKVYIMDTCTWLFRATCQYKFYVMVFDSIKIIMKGVYPPNDYILKIDIGS